MNNNWTVPSPLRRFSAVETNSTSSQTKQLRELPVGHDVGFRHRKGPQPKYKASYHHWDEIPLDCETYRCLVDRGDFD
ncbi:MAG TPA: hypothetical protein V6C95_17930 [Coleofasciculaceae cyanobacterium]